MKALWIAGGMLILAGGQIQAMPSTANPWQLQFQTTNILSPSINLTDLDLNDGISPWAKVTRVQIRTFLSDGGTVFQANLLDPAVQRFNFSKSIDNVDFSATWDGTLLNAGITAKSGAMRSTSRPLSLSAEVYVDLDFSPNTMITVSNGFYLRASGDPDCNQAGPIGGDMWGQYGIGDNASDFYCWNTPTQFYMTGGSYSWSEGQSGEARLGYATQLHMLLPQQPANIPVPAAGSLILLGLGLIRMSRMRC